jgi:hypothetical protein
VLREGPLKRFFLRLAKTSPPVEVVLLLPQEMPSLKVDIGGCRTTRMLLGKALVVGVAGRTFTEWWGLRVGRDILLMDPEPLEEVEEALECVCWWWWMVRIEETEDEVDFRPRRPVLDRRKVERGVNGAGDIECRLLLGVTNVRLTGG